ncbi:UDP-glucose/GDP-mannose dehydrogenase [Candidatus Koribacter versatilis Ellin345]|uniref:UDP-glucose/GDP-mannose dehydrogenase n=1 Tax=Koribacter versatilis (strain Ellin345) TaxID=204669 RepID=Q1IMR6_KORVE|nr:nucleotide sugar dehydrogenase [Candidatus Koribacter versatilis]ABF41834.1 UDP-glucose/GDP-mannose dehydrogenase [Candidatus Koribacter versatilis Ellin345]
MKSQLGTLATELKRKIEAREARIGIVGMGYVGLPLALLFSEEKFRVTGFDIDNRKVEALNAGGSYIVRIPGTEIQGAQKSGFSATADYGKISEMDAVIICVPTPLNEFHEPDLSYITQTVDAIAPRLREGQIVILESTTYPGTTEEVVVPLLEKGNAKGLKVARAEDEGDFFVAFSPEREDPGNDTVARRDIPKVVGGVGKLASEIAAAVYGTIFNRTVPVSSPAAAEMTKLLENIYRCVNIALVNELKQLCHRMDIDIFEVIDAAKTKPFGFQAFYPGPGLGGHCIPIDPFYLSWKAKQFDFRTKFIELAGEVNIAMPYYVIDKTVEALNQHKKSLNGSKVLVLGLAYKKDIDDLRESPSLTIIELLRKGGAEVFYNDPFFAKVGHGRHYDLNMTNTPLENLGQYDAVLIVTDHSDYDYQRIVKESKLVVDSRNATKGITSEKIVRC